ncbi:MAG: shikimate kinase [Firmicutes bacterium]|nr:shikimate kinase [Bacillota bacterium]
MRNIILTGMPACGKSTLGVVLAKTLGMSFVDTDLLIQEHTGRLLQDIIDHDGMEEFLRIEEYILTHVQAENSVIATGGSAVYSDRGMKYLRTIGEIVYIRLPLKEIEKRLNNIKTRGIAMAPGENLEDLYNRRIPLYEKYADIVLDAEGMNLEESLGVFVTKFLDE